MYGGELNKAAGYRPCLNWDSAKFQLPCNWRNLIMSRVKGPWDTMSQIGKLLLSEPRQRAYIIIVVEAAVVAKSSISLLETDHETTVYGDFLYRNTSTFIPKMMSFLYEFLPCNSSLPQYKELPTSIKKLFVFAHHSHCKRTNRISRVVRCKT